MSKGIKKAVSWSLLASLALAAGCNFAPKYSPPPLAAPVAYKETNNWKVAEPSDGVIKGKWWEMFNDPQLNQLEEQVTVSNQTIIAALDNFLVARAAAKQARSELYPTVSATPSLTKTRPSRNQGTATVPGASGGHGGNRIFSDYVLPLDASWEPDLWGSIRNTVAADAFAAQASAAQLENLRLTLQGEVAVDYYELRSQDELIGLYNSTITNYKASLDLTKTLFDTGIDSALDVAQADSLLQTTLAQAAGLRVQRAQYEHAIATLIGQPASTFSLTPVQRPDNPPPIPIGVPSQLLERRPDIASAERTVAQANASIGVARAAYFPTISLTGAGGFQSSSSGVLLTASSLYWTAGASAAETLLDFGKRKAGVQQAWANYGAEAANYRETVLTAFQQVEDNISALRILEDEGVQQGVAIKATQRNYDLALERYRLGINSYLNVISAEVSLLSDQQADVSIRLQQMTSAVQLVLALGGGWDATNLPTKRDILHSSSTTNSIAAPSSN